MLVRIERPSAIPIESLHGRKDDAGRTLRLNVRAIVGAADLGEFSLRPQQGDVRAVFVPLARLQQDLDLAGRVNTLLVADRGDGRPDGTLETSIRQRFALEDVGLTIRARRAAARASPSRAPPASSTPRARRRWTMRRRAQG